MAEFLTINGIAVACAASTYEPVHIGDFSRSLNGVPRSTVRRRASDYRFTTDSGGLALDDAERLRRLVEGDGHVWSFETAELVSSRGLIQSSMTSTDIRSGDVAGKFGLGLFAEDTSVVSWATGFPLSMAPEYLGWSLLFWRLEGVTWHHYVVTSAGAAWKNGAPHTPSSITILTISAAALLTLSCTEGDETIDDLVALPYALSAEWVGLLYAAFQAAAWPALPVVLAKGAAFPGPAATAGLRCLGRVQAAQRIPMRSGGAFVTGEVFDFTLMGL